MSADVLQSDRSLVSRLRLQPKPDFLGHDYTDCGGLRCPLLNSQHAIQDSARTDSRRNHAEPREVPPRETTGNTRTNTPRGFRAVKTAARNLTIYEWLDAISSGRHYESA